MLASSGEMTPPWGVPTSVAVHCPVLHHSRRRATAAAASAPADPRCAAPAGASASSGRCSRSSRGCPHPAHGCRRVRRARAAISSACVALRFGRNPYDEARKSASKIGSSTSVAAICATRSRTVGMPSGRCRPSALGMYRRRTGCGRYVPCAQRGAELVESMRSTPYCSIVGQRHRDRRPPRRDSASPAATPPGGRHRLQIRSSRAWKRRSGDRLAAAQSRALQLAHVVDGRAPTGGVGTGPAGHALARALRHST